MKKKTNSFFWGKYSQESRRDERGVNQQIFMDIEKQRADK